MTYCTREGQGKYRSYDLEVIQNLYVADGLIFCYHIVLICPKSMENLDSWIKAGAKLGITK